MSIKKIFLFSKKNDAIISYLSRLFVLKFIFFSFVDQRFVIRKLQDAPAVLGTQQETATQPPADLDDAGAPTSEREWGAEEQVKQCAYWFLVLKCEKWWPCI